MYGSLDFDRDYVTGCHKLIKQLKLEDNVNLRGLGAPIKVGLGVVGQGAAQGVCFWAWWGCAGGVCVFRGDIEGRKQVGHR